MPDAHQIARAVGRAGAARCGEDAQHLFLRLADRQPADRVAVEADLGERRRATRRAGRRTCRPARCRTARCGCQPVELRARAPRPSAARAPSTRAASSRVAGYGVHSSNTITMSDPSTRWICIDSSGVRNSLSPLTGEANATPSSCTLAQRAEAEHLEAAGVGEERPRPAHEAVQAAVRGDDLEARAQPEVKRVAEHDLRAELDELVRRHRLDGAVGADRHEHRRLDGAVRELEPAAPGAARRARTANASNGTQSACASRLAPAAKRARRRARASSRIVSARPHCDSVGIGERIAAGVAGGGMHRERRSRTRSSRRGGSRR